MSRSGISGMRTLRGPTGIDLGPAPPGWEGSWRISSIADLCYLLSRTIQARLPAVNSPRGHVAMGPDRTRAALCAPCPHGRSRITPQKPFYLAGKLPQKPVPPQNLHAV